MSLEEAERIARNYLPDEPRQDDLTAWRASQPRQERARRERGLDTMPAEPPVDWAAVINGAIRGERAHMVEAIGEAIGEHGNELLDQVETMIAQAIDKLRAEMRIEASRQLEHLRTEFTAQTTELFESVAMIHGQGERLKAQLEAVIAKRTRARAAKPNGGSLLQLPAPNGHAQ
jgi:hypothetical protein